jgi:signal transduction histidine kinase
MGLPIFWHNRIIGVFGIGAAPPRRFTEQDLETLTIFARHAAIAIENARLFEAEKHRAARISIINRVGRLITGSLTLDQLLQTTVEAIAEHLYYQNVALLLIDPAQPDALVLRARSGIYTSPVVGDYRQKIDQGIIGAAIQARHYLLINDVWSDPRYVSVPGTTTISTELAVPIIIGERVLGALNIESEHRMSEEDAAGLEIIADQLGVAIEKARFFAEIQSTLDQTQLLYQTSQRISMAMDVDEVIGAYLEQVAVRGRYACSVVMYDFDEFGQRTAVIVRGQWTHQKGLVHLRERIPYMPDALDSPLDAGQTITIANVHIDPRVSPGLREIQIQDGRPALVMIPLIVRGQRIGLVILSDTMVHEWQPADLHPYQATAAQLATAIDSRRQHHLLSERGRQLAVLRERQRLARDLHDSVTQLIFSMTLIAQSIAPAWRRDPAEGNRRVNRLLELSQAALAEMRALLAELRPPETWPGPPTSTPVRGAIQPPAPIPGIIQMQQDGLVAALQSHIALVASDGLQIKLDPTGYVRQPLEQEEALYRIAQEALNNVVKHACAQCAQVKLDVDYASIHLQVVDDGVGFVPKLNPPLNSSPASGGEQRGGLGLMTMRERVEALGGVIELIAAPGSGATVAVTIPRKDRAS